MESDNARIWTIERELAVQQGRMKIVEEGVANFRMFQADVRTFLVDHKAREEEKEKLDKRRARIHYALLGGLITLIIGLTLWFVSWVTQGKHMVVDSDLRTPTAQNATNPNMR